MMCCRGYQLLKTTNRHERPTYDKLDSFSFFTGVSEGEPWAFSLGFLTNFDHLTDAILLWATFEDRAGLAVVRSC